MRVDLDIEMVGSRGGVPLYRLVVMGPGGYGDQVVLDGLTLIPLARWLWRRLETRHPRWPAAVPLPSLSKRGLPRMVTMVVVDREMAEGLYRLVSYRALETAAIILARDPDAYGPDDEDDEEDEAGIEDIEGDDSGDTQ